MEEREIFYRFLAVFDAVVAEAVDSFKLILFKSFSFKGSGSMAWGVLRSVYITSGYLSEHAPRKIFH